MSLTETILLKSGLRSDSIWTRRFLYAYSRNIPFWLDVRALLKSQYWPRERLESLQRARLARLIEDVSAIPFWKETFEKAGINTEGYSDAGFLKLPVITKKDLSSLPFETITDQRYVSSSYRDRTSGSTGTPLGFLVDRGYVLRAFATCERMVRTAGNGKRFPIISMRSRNRIGFAFKRNEFFFVRGYNSVRHRLDDFLARAQSYPRGFVLYGFVSPLVELARLVRERGATLPVRAVIASGEEMHVQARAQMKDAFGVEIFTCYTLQELGWLGFECQAHALHINEESAYLEILDAAGHQLPAGKEGRVIVTAFDHRVMPFVRYFTGDLGIISDAPCPCGRTLRTLRIKGREAQIIRLDDARTIPLLELGSVFDRFFEAVRQYQIIQTSPLSFTIDVVPGRAFTARQDEMHNSLVRLIHPRVEIRWNMVDSIEAASSSKAIYFRRTFEQ